MNKFDYTSLNTLRSDILGQGLNVPVAEDLAALTRPVTQGRVSLKNAMAILPMEGCDSDESGAPGELTCRRYLRFATGGAGIVWFEAMAVCPEGRGNPRQLYIGEETWRAYADLIRRMRDAVADAGMAQPFIIAQLTHAGRYARPVDRPRPIIAQPNPVLDRKFNAEEMTAITDGELAQLETRFQEGAAFAQAAGFDAVDVKACHRYLISDFLSARNRPGSYGGERYENRVRLLLNIVDKINALGQGIRITPRINGYDAVAYPYGWGSDEENRPSLAEPMRLLQDLRARGVDLVNISCGNPYFNPHVGRPFDFGPYEPPISQIQSSARMFSVISALQASQPDIAVVCTGLSWFREFGANIGAGGIERGMWRVAGFGRQSLAYPDFATDILESGGLARKKCCAACSNCTQIMRDDGTTGCVIRDRALYMPILRKGRNGRPLPGPDVVCDHIP